MFVDSHCHLDFPEFASDFEETLASMRSHAVEYGLCVCVNLRDFPKMLAVMENHGNLFATVGIHPDYENENATSVEELVRLASHPKVVGIGETGLDYYRLQGDLEWQRERFRIHIRAAVDAGLPLIIHSREAAADTLRILQEEGAQRVGGVMHCFTETWEVAQAAMDLGFYISFSGIVTFKNATALKTVAQKVPLDRMLIETDAPYLAPVPHRGQRNQPAYVKYVAEEIARLRGISPEAVGEATSTNFFRLFKRARPCS
ncbi:MAG: TatD family hydrolase [Methylophilaceae bacterium]|nr:TatD family hydrolase [Methylophilaceae bacterium]